MNFQRKPVIKASIAAKDFALLTITIPLAFRMTEVNYLFYILYSYKQQIFINVWERNAFAIYLDVTLENSYHLKSKERVMSRVTV